MAISLCTVTISNPILGGTGTNSWHLRTDSLETTQTDPVNNLMQHLKDFYTAVAGIFAVGTTVAWDGTSTEVGGAQSVHTHDDDWSVGSTASTNPLPPANALVVGWGTATATRSGHGRTFLGPLAFGTAEQDGTPNGATVTEIRDAAAAFISSFDGSGDGAFQVYSTKHSLGRDITSARVRDRFAVLRSRRD